MNPLAKKREASLCLILSEADWEKFVADLAEAEEGCGRDLETEADAQARY